VCRTARCVGWCFPVLGMGLGPAGHGDDEVPVLVAGLDVSMGLGRPFEWIAAVDHRPQRAPRRRYVLLWAGLGALLCRAMDVTGDVYYGIVADAYDWYL